MNLLNNCTALHNVVQSKSFRYPIMTSVRNKDRMLESHFKWTGVRFMHTYLISLI